MANIFIRACAPLSIVSPAITVSTARYPTALHFMQSTAIMSYTPTTALFYDNWVAQLSGALENSFADFKGQQLFAAQYGTSMRSAAIPATTVSTLVALRPFQAHFELSSWCGAHAEHAYQPRRQTVTVNHISTARAAIVMQNAMQKVFRCRFDEGRAYTQLGDLNNSDHSQPLITGQINYKQAIGKTHTSFIAAGAYKPQWRLQD